MNLVFLALFGIPTAALLAVLVVAVLCLSRAFAYPSTTVPLYSFVLRARDLVAGGGASLATYKVPFNCRIVKIRAGILGIDDATSVVIDPEVGTTDLLATPITVATSSAVIDGGAESDPDDVETLAAGDILHLDVTPTGGTSPDMIGAWCEIVVQRLP